MNVVTRIGDIEFVNLFRKYLDKEVLARAVHNSALITNQNKSISMLNVVKRILRTYGYFLQKVKIIDIYESSTKHPLMFQVHGVHAIIVWQNEIFDANNSHTLPFTENNMNRCCGTNESFIQPINPFIFHPSKKRIRTQNLSYNL